MWTDTELTRRSRLALPIVQGPFGGGLSTARLTASVSNAGVLYRGGHVHLRHDDADVWVGGDVVDVITGAINL